MERGKKEQIVILCALANIKNTSYSFLHFLLPSGHLPPKEKKKKARKEERENLLSYFLWCYGFSIFIKLGLGVREIGCPMNYDLSGYTFLLP